MANNGLPTPFEDFIPKFFKESLNQAGQNMASKIDTHLAAWLLDIKKIEWIRRPEQIPAEFLDIMGSFLAAGIEPQDTETQKRKKIYNAVNSHKLRGVFNDDVKPIIDAIAGDSARILGNSFFDSDEWILVGDGVVISDPSVYWASMGADGIDTDLGIALIGDGTEIKIAGNIYIDCHENINVSTLTADQVAQIKLDLEGKRVPAYYKVFLGYVDVSGNFQIYDTIP